MTEYFTQCRSDLCYITDKYHFVVVFHQSLINYQNQFSIPVISLFHSPKLSVIAGTHPAVRALVFKPLRQFFIRYFPITDDIMTSDLCRKSNFCCMFDISCFWTNPSVLASLKLQIEILHPALCQLSVITEPADNLSCCSQNTDFLTLSVSKPRTAAVTQQSHFPH